MVDKFTVRGLLYVAVSGALLSYEMLSVPRPRLFLVLMYSAVVVIGLVLIFFVNYGGKR